MILIPHAIRASVISQAGNGLEKSSKLLAERINDLAMQFGASASHVYELGSVKRISGYDVERPYDTDSLQITLDNF